MQGPQTPEDATPSDPPPARVEDVTERVVEAVKNYAAARVAVGRKALLLGLAGAFLAGVSRTPVTVKVPFEIIEEPLHRGYVMLLGPAVLAVLYIGFCGAVVELLALRRQIMRSVRGAADRGMQDRGGGDGEGVVLTAAEQFELRPPFGYAGLYGGPRVVLGATVMALLWVFGWPLFCYVILLIGYFDLERPGVSNRGIDLLYGWQRGFRPSWPQAPEVHMPWIYPPLQSWLYLIVGIALLAAGVLAALMVVSTAWRRRSPAQSHCGFPVELAGVENGVARKGDNHECPSPAQSGKGDTEKVHSEMVTNSKRVSRKRTRKR